MFHSSNLVCCRHDSLASSLRKPGDSAGSGTLRRLATDRGFVWRPVGQPGAGRSRTTLSSQRPPDHPAAVQRVKSRSSSRRRQASPGTSTCALIRRHDLRISPLGLYITALRAGRADFAQRLRFAAIQQHNYCPLYRPASLALIPAALYRLPGQSDTDASVQSNVISHSPGLFGDRAF